MLRTLSKKTFKIILSGAMTAPIYGCVGSLGSSKKPEFVYENGIKRKCLMWGPDKKCAHAVPIDGSAFYFKTN